MHWLIRIVMILLATIAAVPLIAWFVQPGVVLTGPENVTGLLELVYIVLGAPGRGLPAPTSVLWFYGLFVVTAIEALALALVLLARSWHRSGVPLLVCFLIGVTLYFSVYFVALPHAMPPALAQWLEGSGRLVQWSLLPLGLGIGMASLCHFAARFPNRLSVEAVVAFNLKGVAFSRVAERLASLVGARDTPEKRAHRAGIAFERWIVRPWLWIGFCVSALAFQGLQLFGSVGSAAGMMFPPLLALPTLFLANALFDVQLDVASPTERRQVLWVSSGVRAAMLLWVVSGVAAFGITWVYDGVGWHVYMASLFAFGPMVMAAAVVTALGAAVLVGGVVDPGLAIQRTTGYTALVLLFGFLFAVLEEWLSGALVDQVGVSDQVASIILGATAAMAITPFKGFVDRTVARWIPVAPRTSAPGARDSV